jgi:catechol 2,3-dioxygenase-like lactoylglutathione lyase family enzyme
VIRPSNATFESDLGGINHVALVCADMRKTVDFYSGVLGMPLVKSLDLPGGMGQHFFFDGVPGFGEIVSAVGSLNHLALHVPAVGSTNTESG